MTESAAVLHNPEAERTIIGAVVVDNALMAEVAQQLEPRHFGSKAYGRIFGAMFALFERAEGIDLVTLKAELGADIAAVGGGAALGLLVDGVPRIPSVAEYVGIVLEKARRRAAHNLARRLMEQTLDESADTNEVLDRHASSLSSLIELTSGGTVLDMTAVLRQAVDNLDRFVNGTGITGIASGFPDLDEITGGWQPGELVIVAARPGVGKSTLLGQLIVEAGRRGFRGLVWSMEMPPAKMVERILLSDANIERWDLKVQDKAYSKLSAAMARLQKHPTLFDTRESPTLAQIRSRAVTLHKRAKLDYIAVDYIQRVAFDERLEERIGVGRVVQGLKSLARHLNIPILTAAQLSRQADTKEPTLADLAESGKIEREADIIAFLHPDQETKNLDYPTTHFIMGKSRNTACRRMQFYFDKPHSMFLPAVKESTEWKGAAEAPLPRGAR